MKTVIVTAGVIIEGKKVLVAQRMEDALHGLLWEFPGGKAKEGEDPREALRRELKEELDIDVEVENIFEVVFHSYPEYPILLLAYGCRVKQGVPKPVGCKALRWFNLKELNELALAPADEPIRKRLVSLEGSLF
jgi:8-oxo-dGTP diphosphatase